MSLLPITTPTTRVERVETQYAQIAVTPATPSVLDANLRYTGGLNRKERLPLIPILILSYFKCKHG